MEMVTDAGDVLRVSDNQLSKLLGKAQRHHVSEWRHGKRGMSQKFTARLNKLLVLRIRGQPVSTWDEIDWDEGIAYIYERSGSGRKDRRYPVATGRGLRSG